MKAIALVLILSASGFVYAQEKKSPPAEEKKQERITMAQYQALKTGSTYAEAVKILGREGEEMSRVELGGVVTVMYVWKNADFSNLNAMFQNGKLTSKSQFGLKD